MEATWTEELSPQEEARLIEHLTYEIKRRGLVAPAIVFFEMHKPLAGLVGAAAIVSTPFLAPFMGLGNVQAYGRLFSRRDSIERLLESLEDPSPARKPEGNITENSESNDDGENA